MTPGRGNPGGEKAERRGRRKKEEGDERKNGCEVKDRGSRRHEGEGKKGGGGDMSESVNRFKGWHAHSYRAGSVAPLAQAGSSNL